jgi:undecaprenyl-diphosphatase
MDETVKEYLQTALLAVIQGAAELLPVSSSAHVIFAEKLMGKDPSSPEATFLLVMLHTGTMGAVLVYFWPRWKALLFSPGAGGSAMTVTRFVQYVVLATACTGVLGLGLQYLIEKVVMERMLGQKKAEIEHLFKELPLIGGALFAVGLLILVAARFEKGATARALTARSAAIIGLVQGLVLPFRGFSRSGATISTAFFCGISRQLAEDFSFALAVAVTPAVIAREVYRLLRARAENPEALHLASLFAPGLVGMVLSFLAGLLALRLLSAALERGRWGYFGIYCLVAALVLFGYAFARGMP